MTYNLWYISTISLCLVIHVGTLKLLVISEFWNVISLIAFGFSIVFYYFCLFVLSNNFTSLNFQPELIGIPYNFIKDRLALILLFIAPIVSVFPDIVIKQIFDNINPNPSKYLSTLIHKRFDLDEISDVVKEEKIEYQNKITLHHRKSIPSQQIPNTQINRDKNKILSENNIVNNKIK